MKRLFVLAIAGVFTLLVTVSVVYGFAATASCWKTGEAENGTNHANAMAGSYGLHDGSAYASARVGDSGNAETISFGNNFVTATAHASGDYDEAGTAHAAVSGIDDDGNPRMANDRDAN